MSDNWRRTLENFIIDPNIKAVVGRQLLILISISPKLLGSINNNKKHLKLYSLTFKVPAVVLLKTETLKIVCFQTLRPKLYNNFTLKTFMTTQQFYAATLPPPPLIWFHFIKKYFPIFEINFKCDT